MLLLRATGVPAYGGDVDPGGLLALDRSVPPVGTAYRSLIERWPSAVAASAAGRPMSA